VAEPVTTTGPVTRPRRIPVDNALHIPHAVGHYEQHPS
jgi:hypothetical protein